MQRLRDSARSRRNGRRTWVSGPASHVRWSVATCLWRSRGPRTTTAVRWARPPLSPGWTITIACWLSRRSGRSTPATIVARPVTTRPGASSRSGWSSTVKETKITDGRPSMVFTIFTPIDSYIRLPRPSPPSCCQSCVLRSWILFFFFILVVYIFIHYYIYVVSVLSLLYYFFSIYVYFVV